MFFLTRIPFIICVIRLILNDVSQFFQLGKRTHGRLFQVGCFLKLWRLILFNPIIVAGRLTEMKHLQIQRYLPLHEELKQYFVIELQLCGSKAFTQKIMLALTLFLENDWVRLLKTCLHDSFWDGCHRSTLSWPCPTIKQVNFTALWVFYDVCSHINNWDVDSLISGISGQGQKRHTVQKHCVHVQSYSWLLSLCPYQTVSSALIFYAT